MHDYIAFFFQKTCLLLCIEPWHKNSLISSHLSHYTASQTTLLSLLTSCEQPVMDYCMSIGIYVIICPFFAGWREKRWTRYWYAWAVRDPQTSVAAGNGKMKPQGEGGTRCSEWQQDQLVNTHLHFNLPLEWHTHWQPTDVLRYSVRNPALGLHYPSAGLMHYLLSGLLIEF